MRKFRIKGGYPKQGDRDRNAQSSEGRLSGSECRSSSGKTTPVPKELTNNPWEAGMLTHPNQMAQTGAGDSLYSPRLTALLVVEVKIYFTDFCPGLRGWKTTCTSSPLLLFLNEAQSHLFGAFAQYNPEGHNSPDHKQCKIIC